jgi:hypothetical protein
MIDRTHVEDGEARVRIAIEARDQRGELKAAGDALIALPA